MRYFGKGRFKRKKAGTMNGLETNYARHLATLKSKGEIDAFWFESFKIRLADKCWYTPDFLVLKPDGFLEFHETKGAKAIFYDDAKVKIKVSAESWPFRFFVVYHAKGGVWQLEEV